MSDSALKRLRPNSRWFPLTGTDMKDREGQERLCQRLSASRELFEAIQAYMNEKREVLNRGEESLEDFEDNAWPYKQAFRAGQRAAYKEIEAFLPIDPQKK